GALPMGVAAQSAAPRGFVQFCARQPGDCGASPAEMEAMQLASAQTPSAAVAAIAFDWSGAFKPSGGPMPQPLTPYDWPTAFRQARGEGRVTTAPFNANDPLVAKPAAAGPVVRAAAGAPLALTPDAW